jgi:hypothetical protein
VWRVGCTVRDVDKSEDGTDQDPVDEFLAQPARHYDEDVESQRDEVRDNGPRLSFKQRLHHFLFEKSPSPYSSIAPRKADGTRTKTFFFNGNGRGR